jgi:ribonuclease P protein component
MARAAKDLSRFSKPEIDKAFKKARRVVKHAGLHLLVAPQQGPHGRILIIIPRKVGKSPERNKIKRRLKAIFYEEKLYEKGFDCIAIAKPGAAQISFDELKKLLLQAFQPS